MGLGQRLGGRTGAVASRTQQRRFFGSISTPSAPDGTANVTTQKGMVGEDGLEPPTFSVETRRSTN